MEIHLPLQEMWLLKELTLTMRLLIYQKMMLRYQMMHLKSTLAH